MSVYHKLLHYTDQEKNSKINNRQSELLYLILTDLNMMVEPRLHTFPYIYSNASLEVTV